MGTLTPSSQTAPATYEELWSGYMDYVIALVQKFGIRHENAEDVAASILLTFYERDFLAQFDANFTTEIGGKTRRSTFTGFLSGFVSKYVLAHRDKQMTYDRRVVAHLSDKVGEDGAEWQDVYMRPTQSHEDTVTLLKAYEDARVKIAAMPIRGTRDLNKLLDICERQIRESGAIDRHEIASIYGVSPTAVSLMFGDLREQLVALGVWGVLPA